MAKKEQDSDTSTGVGSQESVAWGEQLLLGVGQAAEGRMEGKLRERSSDGCGEGGPDAGGGVG